MKILIFEAQLKTLIKQFLLNEEHIGRTMDTSQQGYYDIYKNPKSIHNMKEDLRGIINPDGDLFIVDDGRHVIHRDLSGWLFFNGYNCPKNTYNEMGKYVLIQRDGKTNNFYLGESYSDFMMAKYIDNIYITIDAAKKKNPQYKFFARKITDKWFHDLNA
jgi:hypothetical protein